jgi:hypothetical protein
MKENIQMSGLSKLHELINSQLADVNLDINYNTLKLEENKHTISESVEKV